MYFNDFKKLVKGAEWVGFGLWVSEDDSVIVRVSKAKMIEILKNTGEFFFSIQSPENTSIAEGLIYGHLRHQNIPKIWGAKNRD